MDNWLKNVKEGDFLFFVPRHLRWNSPGPVRVNKVGRKWITLASYKGRVDRTIIDVENGVPTDYTYGSPDRVYLSEEHYEKCLKLRKLRIKIQECCAAGIDDVQTLAIADILNLEA